MHNETQLAQNSRFTLFTAIALAAGDSKQIKAFAASKGFKGSLFDKVDVNGPNGASPTLPTDPGQTPAVSRHKHVTQKRNHVDCA